MRNIVIVTWIGNGNYGTTLQSFALHKKIELLGYQVCILNHIPPLFTFKHYIKYLLSCIGVDVNYLKQLLYPPKYTVKQNKLKRFIKNNYNIINSINTKTQLQKLNNKTDVFITGSDQIWNTKYKFDPFYFLYFAEDTKRIAYASSIGTEDFSQEYKNQIKLLLNKFTHIGVRERSAQKSISVLLNRKDIKHVLDPTFLLNSSEWAAIGEKAEIEIQLPKRYIFCYLIGNNEWYKQQLLKVQQTLGIKDIIIIPSVENQDFFLEGAIIYNDGGPTEFIRLIQNAEFICTDSFHATALSINFKKDFVEFMRFKDTDKASQNSRIYDILSHYNLMSRIYQSKCTEWSTHINYTECHILLEQDRKSSLDYLINAIEN